jgi:hypothetical protein
MTRLAIFSKADGRMYSSVILFKQTHISAPGSPLISVASLTLHEHTDDRAQGRLSIKLIELTHTGVTRTYR